MISISSDEDDGSSFEGVEEEYESDFSEEDDDDDDNDGDDDDSDYCEVSFVKFPTRKTKRRKRNPKAPPEPPLEVVMKPQDVPSAPGKPDHQSENNGEMEENSLLVDGAGKKKAEDEIKHRIIKLLNTGFHDQSNEHEAKNAMKLAQRLMRKHNLSQALLLKEREKKNSQKSDDDETLKGGFVRLNIVNRKTRKPPPFSRWFDQLMGAIALNFGVKVYSSRLAGVECGIVFYGIYSNSQLAGYAFKISAERISQMMTEYQPQKDWRNITTKSARLSYAIGMCRGIYDDVKRNIEMEKEKRKRKLERAKLAGTQGEAYEESDEEDFADDKEGPGISLVKEESKNNDDAFPNDVGSNGVKPDPEPVSSAEAKPDTPRSISGIDLQNRVEELEKEEQAALVLVDHSERIAEDLLKEEGIKLSARRKKKPIRFDNRSYNKGIEDSKEIDINQRAIRDEVKVKVEKS